MAYEDVLSVILNPERDRPALQAADAIARPQGHITALHFEVQPDPVYTADGVIVAAVWAEVLKHAHEDFQEDHKRLERIAAEGARTIAMRTAMVTPGTLGPVAAVHARHADITVLVRPEEGHADLRNVLLDGVLFGSGRPVLLVPPGWKKQTIGRNVCIGWNGKREASRAVSDAARLLTAAERVAVVTVDAQPTFEGYGEAPGADIAAHLARQGLDVTVRNVDSMGRTDAKSLLDEANAIAADLIVVGGYGRMRLSEYIFGGVTRELSRSSPIPVLMSH